MTLKRFFLDWDKPLVASVTDYLVPDGCSGILDFSDSLIVVPTRQAGRRLREAVAVRCAELGGVAVSLATVTPADMFRSENGESPLFYALVWAELLQNLNLDNYRGLFPVDPVAQDFSWAFNIGKLIHELRLQLSENGLSIADVLNVEELMEADRWRDILSLETLFLQKLSQYNCGDVVSERLKLICDYKLPDSVKRVVVVSVADPLLLFKNLMHKVSEEVEIDILIHAPEDSSGCFDDFGCPLPLWKELPIPLEIENIHLVANPSEQANEVVKLIANSVKNSLIESVADVALGTPDPQVMPFVKTKLDEYDLKANDPSAKTLSDHSVGKLVMKLANFSVDDSYETFSEIVRHPLVFEWFGAKLDIIKALSELDKFQNEHLPLTYSALKKLVWREQKLLPDFIKFCECFLSPLGNASQLSEGIHKVMEVVTGEKTLQLNNSDDLAWQAAAVALSDIFSDADHIFSTIKLSRVIQAQLFNELVVSKSFTVAPEEGHVDLEGWLELAWNDAPLAIVTGMNEGMVPKTPANDSFLPDSLRQQLGMTRDETRLATDCYLLHTMIHSRKNRGKVMSISGKYSVSGDPLKPSRLLFRCSENELLERVQKLMGEAQENSSSAAPVPGFKLEIPAKENLVTKDLFPEFFSPSRLKDYLRCPFRYFLNRVLKMKEQNNDAKEMDALAFGNMIHWVMSQLIEIRECCDVVEIEKFLLTKLDEYVKRTFGDSPSFLVEMQVNTALQRLKRASVDQASLVEQGWIIENVEHKVDFEISPGIRVGGTIDRIDWNANTNSWRIYDYKTTDSAKEPQAAHLSNPNKNRVYNDYCLTTIMVPKRRGSKDFVEKEKVWSDLQLPLYCLIWDAVKPKAGEIECCYFNLPINDDKAGVVSWPDVDNSLASAKACTEAVVSEIREFRFWPPTEKVDYDDFENLFCFSPEQCVDYERSFDNQGRLK